MKKCLIDCNLPAKALFCFEKVVIRGSIYKHFVLWEWPEVEYENDFFETCWLFWGPKNQDFSKYIKYGLARL